MSPAARPPSLFFFIIMLKATIVKTIQECCKGTALTKVEKFQVFCHVCDNMLAEGHITGANTRGTPMFSKEDTDFIDMLFGKLVKHVDMDMIDLHDDDSCCDHLEFEQLALF